VSEGVIEEDVRAVAQVDDDEVVTQAFDFGERQTSHAQLLPPDNPCARAGRAQPIPIPSYGVGGGAVGADWRSP